MQQVPYAPAPAPAPAPMPREKKMSAGMKVWRVIYPVLLWLGTQLAVEFGFLFAYGFSYTFDPSSADVVEDLTTYLAETLSANSLMITFWANLAAIVILLVFYLRDRFRVDRGSPLNKNGVRNPLSYVLTAFSSSAVCIVFNIFVTILVTYAVAAFGEEIMETYDELSEAISATPMAIQFLSVVLVGPVCEELVMRGLVFKRLRGDMRFIWAALISSAIFGFVHLNWVQFVYAFSVGMIAAFIYEYTRNLLAPIILHVVANGVSTLAGSEELGPYFENLMFGPTMLFTILVGSASIVTGLIAIKFISDNQIAKEKRINSQNM